MLKKNNNNLLADCGTEYVSGAANLESNQHRGKTQTINIKLRVPNRSSDPRNKGPGFKTDTGHLVVRLDLT